MVRLVRRNLEQRLNRACLRAKVTAKDGLTSLKQVRRIRQHAFGKGRTNVLLNVRTKSTTSGTLNMLVLKIMRGVVNNTMFSSVANVRRHGALANTNRSARIINGRSGHRTRLLFRLRRRLRGLNLSNRIRDHNQLVNGRRL